MYGQRERERERERERLMNMPVGRGREASNVVNPSIHRTTFHGLSTAEFLGNEWL
jgi:hypothetical protein